MASDILTIEMIKEAKATAIAGRPKHPVCYLCGSALKADEIEGKKRLLIPCLECRKMFHEAFMRAIS